MKHDKRHKLLNSYFHHVILITLIPAFKCLHKSCHKSTVKGHVNSATCNNLIRPYCKISCRPSDRTNHTSITINIVAEIVWRFSNQQYNTKSQHTHALHIPCSSYKVRNCIMRRISECRQQKCNVSIYTRSTEYTVIRNCLKFQVRRFICRVDIHSGMCATKRCVSAICCQIAMKSNRIA